MAPIIIPLGTLTAELPTFTTGPVDLFGTGDGVCLDIGLVGETDLDPQ